MMKTLLIVTATVKGAMLSKCSLDLTSTITYPFAERIFDRWTVEHFRSEGLAKKQLKWHCAKYEHSMA